MALALLAVLVGVFWARPIEAHVKSILLLSEVLPQVPVKPLSALTDRPVHKTIVLTSPQGTIVADLFLPAPPPGQSTRYTTPAVILAMGVKMKPRDKPLILDFAQALSRLGYVVLWPRLQALDKGASMLEHPSTFIVSFRYLQGLDRVAPQRISLLGISAGASVAFVAAADPRINKQVHALIFFGGYYDIVDYLASLATGVSSFNNRTIAWHPSPEAVKHVQEILRAGHAQGMAQAFATATKVRTLEQAGALLRSVPEREMGWLRQVSPSNHSDTFKARIFILHDKGDDFVPYLQSAQLNQSLPRRVERTYLITDLFEHVQPGQHISSSTVRDVVQLYGLLYGIIGYL
jgi:pimeloyl-ACP methyl ester carboxylesterase